MKTKKIVIIFGCVLLAVFLLGVTDVARMANTVMGEERLPENDRLIGVFITTEYLDLFDAEGYLNDHAGDMLSGGEISEADGAAYEGRLYATLEDKSCTNEETGETVRTREYVFDGVEGFSYFCALIPDAEGDYYGSSGDEAISDGHTAINSSDAGDSITLEGTIYVSVRGGPDAFYYNPVYQTASGEVYAATGQGMSYGGDITAGMSGSYSFNEKTTVTNDGETAEVGTDITISVSYIDLPRSATIIQLDGESQALSRETYASGRLPDTLEVQPGTEYIIVETASVGADGGEVRTRELFQSGDETLSAYCCRDDGICVRQYCDIEWNT